MAVTKHAKRKAAHFTPDDRETIDLTYIAWRAMPTNEPEAKDNREEHQIKHITVYT